MTVSTGSIIKLRKERGWSQEQLAAISGLSERTIQRIEKDGTCSLDSKMAIASAFDISPAELEFHNNSFPGPDDDPMDWAGAICFVIWGLLTPILIYAFTFTNGIWGLVSILGVSGLAIVLSISINGLKETYELLTFTPWLSLPRQKISVSKCNSLVILGKDIIQNVYIVGIVFSLVYVVSVVLHVPEKLQSPNIIAVEAAIPIIYAILFTEFHIRPIKRKLERCLAEQIGNNRTSVAG